MDLVGLDEAIPKAQKAGDELIDRAERAEQTVVETGLMHFAARVEEVINDTLGKLDGWTVKVTHPALKDPIVIQITRPK